MKIVKIYGKHAVISALQNEKRQIKKLYTSDQNFIDKNKHLPVHFVNNSQLSKMVPENEIHGGFVLECSDIDSLSIHEFLFSINSKDSSKIVILDQVTDPHNIGAIIRSALAFNIDAIILTERNSPNNMATISRTSAGCIEKMPLIYVNNLANTIDLLKENNFWVVGLDGYADKTLDTVKAFDKLAIVLGSEGSGMRQLTKKKCDLLVKININSEVESINVSNAAAITFYELTK